MSNSIQNTSKMENAEATQEYVLKKYDDLIKYYWQTSKKNKKFFKWTRSLTIVLGAVVTLIASLSSASFIQDKVWADTAFAIMTPVIAATLTIVGGFAQSFHWGATWRDMVVNAELLQKEKDRFLAIKPTDRDLKKELEIVNNLLLKESRTFFQRVLESEVKPTDDKNPTSNT